MKLIERPIGYLNAQPEHVDPVQSPPPPKLIQTKEEETLMGGAMKAFVKERLYGNFINFNKLNYNKRYNFTPTSESYSTIKSQSRQSSPAINDLVKLQIKEIKSSLPYHIKSPNPEIFNRQLNLPTRNSNPSSLQNYNNTHKRSQSMLGHNKSFKDRQSNTKHSRAEKYESLQDKESVLSRSKKYLHKRIQSKDNQDRYDLQSYQGASFISAVDDLFDKPRKKAINQIKLTPLQYKHQASIKQRINTKDNNSIMTKKNIRTQLQKFNINSTVWQAFCVTRRSKIIQTITEVVMDKPNSLIKSFLDNTKLNPSSQLSLLNPIKTKLKAPQNDKLKGSRANLSFSKDFFISFINSSKYNYTELSSFYYQFFQMNSKTYQDMKMEDYRKVIQIMVSANMRIWSISAFKFWDVNNDGMICSKDIFVMYQRLQQMQGKYVREKGESQRGYLMVLRMKNMLQKLRGTLLQLKLQNELAKKIQATRNSPSKKIQFEIKYLQEAVIRKSDLKYSDLVLILGQATKSNNHNSVIDIHKSITIKFSSCYRHSFLANQHNEQTRQDRDHIETLKIKLKKEKMQVQQRQVDAQLYSERLGGIGYGVAVDRNLFVEMREMVLQVFGVQLQ